MKKFISLILTFSLIFTFSACGNSNTDSESKSDKKGSNNSFFSDSSEKDTADTTAKAPQTVMDLFDGERRVWYLLLGDEIAYDSAVKAVIVTENQMVVEGYYRIQNSIYSYLDVDLPHPYAPSFTLEDFEGMSDADILNMVRSTYADISKSYGNYTIDFPEQSSTLELVGRFEATSLPYKITYNGNLDSSGNKLIDEKVKLFKNIPGYNAVSTRGTNFAYNAFDTDYYYTGTINPTVIKDKEYVGIECHREPKGSRYRLITINDFASFGTLSFDDPAGVTE